ncbi:RHS repeat-associated core domain-containing protein [Burkholderia ubonensis]|uniref:RHS repeat-associated core domain-containing protein n=1 Tax=Burkholderia ubonensis TaxID=101571 RepID=UPI000AB4EC3A|nr:RHS repeat-associated core domain-containing protein [Burkholderia ubonensis]
MSLQQPLEASRVHSNAFNFLSFVQSGVDPRTGQYTFSVNLPPVAANALCGPLVPLSLSFSPMQGGDQGLGLGWSLGLSSYESGTRRLRLSSGEQWQLNAAEDAIPDLLLDTLRVARLGNDAYRLVHKNGAVEILRNPARAYRRALPDEVHSPEGRRVFFEYEPIGGGERLLRAVRDDSQRLLELTRTAGGVTLTFYPDTQAPVPFVLRHENSQVREIALPGGGAWQLRYGTVGGQLCLTGLDTPTGARETIEYAERGHAFPSGGPTTPLARVERHIVSTGAEQAPPVQTETHYTYTGTNFLGYDAPNLRWEDGLDNLYKVLEPYGYGSTEMHWEQGRAVRSTVRRYNRFHLLTEETVSQAGCVRRIVTTYPERSGLPFHEQVPQCQLPQTVTTTWYREDAPGEVREEIERTTFDEHGNLVEEVAANGVRQTYTYYPAEGEGADCPPDAYGFVRHLKYHESLPAPVEANTPVEGAAAHPIRMRYRYAQLASLHAGEPAYLVRCQALREEMVGGAGALREQVDYTQVDDPRDFAHYGRLRTETVTRAGRSTTTTHAYALEAGLLVDEVSVTGFDGCRDGWTQRRSLATGQAVTVREADGQTLDYEYDALGRVVSETVARGSAWEATRRYAWHLASAPGERVTQEAKDVNGVTTTTIYDGLQRVVRIEAQDGDMPGAPVRVTYTAGYNALGQLVEETQTDWLEGRALPLTTRYDYDAWGELARTWRPDGVTEHTEHDPVARRVTHWLEGRDGRAGGRTVTVSNVSGQPVSETRYDETGKAAGEVRWAYDGFGRCVAQTDRAGRCTRHEYDWADREMLTVHDDGTRIVREFAAHSEAALTVGLEVNGTGVGSQTYDGLSRLTEQVVGGLARRWDFEGGNGRPFREHTPAGHTLKYRYEPQLQQQLVHRMLEPGGVHAAQETDYDYHPRRGTLTLASDVPSGQTYALDYYPSGRLKAEEWTYADGGVQVTRQTHYVHSMAGRALRYTDAGGLVQRNSYNDFGQLWRVECGLLSVVLHYDNLSRLERIEARDAGGRTLDTTLFYDAFGRETERVLVPSNGLTQVLEQTYTMADQVELRRLMQAEQVLREETYTYDQRARLVDYACVGSAPVRDAHGHLVRAQTWKYDAWDNVRELTTVFEEADGTRAQDVATFVFADPADPVRLTGITHSHPAYPASVTLAYDADGNLTRDERGYTLAYDPLGRLVRVERDGQTLGEYGYDPLDRLVHQAPAGQAALWRSYRDEEWVGAWQDGRWQRTLREDGLVLGGQADGRASLYGTDARQSVMRVIEAGQVRELAYTPWGWREVQPAGVPGFNGEAQDPVSGCYLPGQGYRAYSASLMRFTRPDSLSPFGEAGPNPYAYCLGDPVNWTDRSGHLPFWANMLIGVAATVATAVVTAGVGTLVGAAAANTSWATAAFAGARVAGYLGTGLGVAGAAVTLASLGVGLSGDEDTANTLGKVGMGLTIGAAAFGGFGAGVLKGGGRVPIGNARGRGQRVLAENTRSEEFQMHSINQSASRSSSSPVQGQRPPSYEQSPPSYQDEAAASAFVTEMTSRPYTLENQIIDRVFVGASSRQGRRYLLENQLNGPPELIIGNINSLKNRALWYGELSIRQRVDLASIGLKIRPY